MDSKPYAFRGVREINPRWADETPKPARKHPVVAAMGETVPHFFPYFSEIVDENGLRIQFACAIMRPLDLKTPWIIIDDFDLTVIEPNKRRRALSMDYIAERARARGAMVQRYAKAHRQSIGYIPYVRGAYIDKNTIEYAKLGGIVPLIVP